MVPANRLLRPRRIHASLEPGDVTLRYDQVRATREALAPGAARWRLFAFVGSFLLSLAGPDAATAQEPSPRPEDVFEEAVSVLEVEVWVRVERGGEPLTGLGAEDFEVLAGKRTLPIVAFEAFDLSRADPDGAALESPAASGAPPPTARHILVLFDVGRTSSAYLQKGADGLRAMLEGGFDPNDRLAMGLWGAQTAGLLHGFTTDRGVAAAALDVVDAVLGRSKRRLRDSLATLERASPKGDLSQLIDQVGLGGALLSADQSKLQQLFTVSTAGGWEEEIAIDAQLDDGEGNRFWDADYLRSSAQIDVEVDATRALAELMGLLSGVPGPRHALLFAQGYSAFTSTMLEFSPYEPPPRMSALLGAYRSLTDAFLRSGWVVSSFDVSGVGGGGAGIQAGHDVTSEGSAGFVPFQPGGLAGDGSDSLFYVARRTGGDLYDNYKAMDRAVERMLERTAAGYRLVFQVVGDDLASGALEYQIRLRGDARGAVLRGAKEYRVVREQLDSRRDPWQLQQRLLGTDEVRELGARIRAVASPAGVGQQRAVLAVDLPLPGTAKAAASVWIQAVSLDPLHEEAGPSVAIHDGWSQRVDLAGDVEPTSRVVAFGDLLAPCEGARLRVRLLLQDDEREELTSLEVPPCDRAAPLEVLALGRVSPGAVVTHEPGFEPSDSAVSPLAIGGRSFLPAAEPVVPTGDAVSLLVSARGWSGGDRVEALLVDGDSQPVRTGPLEPERLELERSAVRFLTTFPVAGLDAGNYRLLLRWLDGDEVRGNAEIAIEIP